MRRWWQAVIWNPGSLHRELHNLRLSRLAGILFIVSLLFFYLGNTVILDIMPVLYVLFSVAGLSLIHYFLGLFHSPMTWFWLLIIYTILVLTIPMSFVVLALIALIDIWFDVN